MRCEEKLLVALARINHQLRVNEFNQLTGKKFDWLYFLALSKRHKSSSIVYLNLKKFPAPEPVLTELVQVYRKTVMDNLLIENELKRLALTFKKEGIEPILLKGFSLIEQAYQKKGLRPMGDIDLLVRPEALEQSQKIINSLGYEIRLPSGIRKNYLARVHASKDVTKSLMHGFDYYNQKEGTKLDLQWRPFPKRHNLVFELNEWHKNTIRNENLNIKLLSPEYQLLHLALHGVVMHSLDYRFYMITDLFELIEHQQIEWDKIIKLSKKMRIEKYVYFAGLLVNKFYGEVFPSKILNHLKPSLVNRCIYRVLAKDIFIFGRLPKIIVTYPLAFLRNKVFRAIPFSIPF